METSVAPISPNIRPISSRPLASPHLGNMTCASVANSSRMLSPVDVTPPLSNALRYSSATDLRCSSVIVCVLTATVAPFLTVWIAGTRRALLPSSRVDPEAIVAPAEGPCQAVRGRPVLPTASGADEGWAARGARSLDQCRGGRRTWPLLRSAIRNARAARRVTRSPCPLPPSPSCAPRATSVSWPWPAPGTSGRSRRSSSATARPSCATAAASCRRPGRRTRSSRRSYPPGPPYSAATMCAICGRGSTGSSTTRR